MTDIFGHDFSSFHSLEVMIGGVVATVGKRGRKARGWSRF